MISICWCAHLTLIIIIIVMRHVTCGFLSEQDSCWGWYVERKGKPNVLHSWLGSHARVILHGFWPYIVLTVHSSYQSIIPTRVKMHWVLMLGCGTISDSECAAEREVTLIWIGLCRGLRKLHMQRSTLRVWQVALYQSRRATHHFR